MNIPSLPTDNLYKFLALSGLAIAIFGLVFPAIRISEIRLKLIEANTQTRLLKLEIDQLKEDVDTAKKKSSVSPEEIGNIRKRMIEINVKKVELDGRTEQIKALMEDLNFARGALKVSAPLGLVISFLGFYFWYSLIQKPNDLLLQKQIKKEKI
jgi:hypothetical protein